MVRDVLLGRVAVVLESGGLLVKAPGPLPVRLPQGPRHGLRVGANVADAAREPVGRITDILGPVSSPYVHVTPMRGARLHRLLGKDVYAVEGEPARGHGGPRGAPGGRPPYRGGGGNRPPPRGGAPGGRPDGRPGGRSGGRSGGPSGGPSSPRDHDHGRR